MPLPEQIVDSVAIDNVKAIAGASAFYSNLAMANAVNMQQLQQQESLSAARAMEVARLNAIHQGSRIAYESQVEEARSNAHVLSGDAVAQQMQALLAALNSGQQGVKSAQTTPPVTP